MYKKIKISKGKNVYMLIISKIWCEGCNEVLVWRIFKLFMIMKFIEIKMIVIYMKLRKLVLKSKVFLELFLINLVSV